MKSREKMNKKKIESSWEGSHDWYDKIVGLKGHYYHEQLILPFVIKALDLEATKKVKLLDLACGQGILERALPKGVSYVGVDVSPSLIKAATQHSQKKDSSFLKGDITK